MNPQEYMAYLGRLAASGAISGQQLQAAQRVFRRGADVGQIAEVAGLQSPEGFQSPGGPQASTGAPPRGFEGSPGGPTQRPDVNTWDRYLRGAGGRPVENPNYLDPNVETPPPFQPGDTGDRATALGQEAPPRGFEGSPGGPTQRPDVNTWDRYLRGAGGRPVENPNYLDPNVETPPRVVETYAPFQSPGGSTYTDWLDENATGGGGADTGVATGGGPSVGDTLSGIPEAGGITVNIDYGFLGSLLADSRRFAGALVEGNQQVVEAALGSITQMEAAFWGDYEYDAGLIGGAARPGSDRPGGVARLDIYAADILAQQGISNVEIANVSVITDLRMEQIEQRAGVIAADVSKAVGVNIENLKIDAIEHTLAIHQVKQAQAQIDAMNAQTAALEQQYQGQYDATIAGWAEQDELEKWLIAGTPEEIAAKYDTLGLLQQARG